MNRNAVASQRNSFVVEGYSRIDFTWDWSIFLQKVVIALALLTCFLLGGKDLTIILKQLLS